MQLLRFTLFFIMICLSFACNSEDESNGEEQTQEEIENTNALYLDAANCENIVPTYTSDIKEIMDTRCAFTACHDAVLLAGGIALDTYNNIITSFEEYNFLCSIHHGSECEIMPIGADKLSDMDIELITCWAKTGFTE